MLTMRNDQTKTTSMKHKRRTDNNGEGKTINILCATDDKYAPFCGVMLTSFLENHKGFHTEVYIIVKSRLKEEKRLKRLEERYDVKVNIVEFPFSDITSSFPIGNRYWTIETYYRLFAPVLLPKDIDRILYLDCDIIVDGDVSEMYFSEIKDISAIVTTDFMSIQAGNPKRLGYDESFGYFNAGMMLINISYWREHDILQRSINYIKENSEILFLYDQDVLNYVLHDSKKFIGIEYNFFSLYITKMTFDSIDENTKKAVINCKPRIIHFIKPKPWSIFSYKFPLTRVWEKYCKVSLWSSPFFKELPKDKPFNYFIKRYFLWPFGIKFHIFEAIDEWKKQ